MQHDKLKLIFQQRPSLKHQIKWKSDPNDTKEWYNRGAKVFQADKYRIGACMNYGAMTHDTKICMERPLSWITMVYSLAIIKLPFHGLNNLCCSQRSDSHNSCY